MLGYQCANSEMTLAVAMEHWVDYDGDFECLERGRRGLRQARVPHAI